MSRFTCAPYHMEAVRLRFCGGGTQSRVKEAVALPGAAHRPESRWDSSRPSQHIEQGCQTGKDALFSQWQNGVSSLSYWSSGVEASRQRHLSDNTQTAAAWMGELHPCCAA